MPLLPPPVKGILAALVIFAVPLAAHGQDDLVAGGSFDVFEDGVFEGWLLAPRLAKDGSGKFGKASQDARGGCPKGGSAFLFTFSARGAMSLQTEKPMPIEPGMKYRLVVHTKRADGNAALTGAVRLMGIRDDSRNEKAFLRSLPIKFAVTEEWQEHVLEWETAENETSAQIRLTFANPGGSSLRVWVDEVTLSPL